MIVLGISIGSPKFHTHSWHIQRRMTGMIWGRTRIWMTEQRCESVRLAVNREDSRDWIVSPDKKKNNVKRQQRERRERRETRLRCKGRSGWIERLSWGGVSWVVWPWSWKDQFRIYFVSTEFESLSWIFMWKKCCELQVTDVIGNRAEFQHSSCLVREFNLEQRRLDRRFEWDFSTVL